MNNATATLRHVTVTNNSAPNSDIGEGLAGGVCNNGTMLIEQSTICSNNGEEAGGIYNIGSQLVINQSTINSNSTGSFGVELNSSDQWRLLTARYSEIARSMAAESTITMY